MAELIGGSGYDDVQNTQPTNPSIGDTWLDTSVDPPVSQIWVDLGSGGQWAKEDVVEQILTNLDAPISDVTNELTTGRTRELLLLLQGSPIPEVVDPLNIQSGLSDSYTTDGNGDYIIGLTDTTPVSRGNDTNQSSYDPNSTGLVFNPNQNISGVKITISSMTSGVYEIQLRDSNGNALKTKSGSWASGDVVEFEYALSSGTDYQLIGFASDHGYNTNASFPYTGTYLDIINGSPTDGSSSYPFLFNDLIALIESNNGYITDQFAAPTTAPADFKQWNTIRAEDVTTGGSTSPEPVEFEILDSADNALNSTRIPKAQIADSPFIVRERVASVSAGSAGQSAFTIPTTGDGGHFGIPILTVVSVKKNGSLIDSANWEYDDVDTVTIDTANVTIASGDTIEMKYDFDVFDSTLQPRAYLNRAATGETSPSISHFRYEYLV